MKFKIEVELDELIQGYIDEDGEWVSQEPSRLEDLVVDKIAGKLMRGIENRIGPKIDDILEAEVQSTVTKILGPMVDGLMDKEIEVTDEWGKVKYSGTVRAKVTARFESFLSEKVDKNGSPDNYGRGIMTRTEWFISQVMKKDMDSFIESTVSAIKSAVKSKLTTDLQAAVGNEIVNSIGVKNVLDRLQLPEKK